MSSPSARKLAARGVAAGRGNSVSKQRINHRNDFINRLKALRIREVDKLREICSKGLGYNSLLEIRKVLLSDKDEQSLVEDSQEFDDIIKAIENELLEMEAELYEKQNLDEVEALTQTHLYPCHLCESLIVDGVICDKCKFEFAKEM